MSGGIDKVQNILLALVRIVHACRLKLNRNASLSLEIHRVENLLLHFTRFYSFSHF